jgi:hypothetical protein
MAAADRSEPQAAFRIAIREEGNNVNAYLAQPNTMDNALHLGSLTVQCARIPGVFDGFVKLMQQATARLSQDVLGEKVSSFQIQQAPEHEKAGKA